MKESPIINRRQWLLALQESMGEATIATDSQCRVTYLNTTAADLLGLKAEHLLGMHLNELVSIVDPTNGKPVALPLERVIAKQEYYSTDEGLMLRDAQGRLHRITFTISPLKGNGLKKLGAVVALVAYSSHKKRKQALPVSQAPKVEEGQSVSEFFFVKKEGNFVKVIADDILWIEAMENYAILVTDKERFVVHSTLKGLVEKLKSQGFARTHRSYIVPLNKIEAIEDNRLYIGEQTIPIGKSFRSSLMKSLMFI